MNEKIDVEFAASQNEHLSDINKKEFPIGSLVYFLDYPVWSSCGNWMPGKKDVCFGIVEEHYPSSIGLAMIEQRDTRCIDGVPVKEFKTPTRWHKLPKGWTYNTKLFKIESTSEPLLVDISDKENILQLYNEGKLVNVADNERAHFEVEIDKRYGWRIIRTYPISTRYRPSYVSVNYHNVFASYEEAKSAANKIEAELIRQSELSDYDWAVEQIDRIIDDWQKLFSGTDIEKEKYRKWILQQGNIESIELRIADGGIQWKYFKNKKWLNIVI